MKRIFEKSCGETDQPGRGGDRKEAGSKRGPGAAVGRAAFTPGAGQSPEAGGRDPEAGARDPEAGDPNPNPNPAPLTAA